MKIPATNRLTANNWPVAARQDCYYLLIVSLIVMHVHVYMHMGKSSMTKLPDLMGVRPSG